MAWSDSEHNEIVKGLAIACEVTGADYSQAARQFIVRELEAHAPVKVLTALRRAARECRGKLTLAEILGRIDEEDAKDKAKQNALRVAEESRLRIAAISAGVPWELGIEKVREALGAKALPAHAGQDAKTRVDEILRQLGAARNPPHWQEKAEEQEHREELTHSAAASENRGDTEGVES